MERQVASVIKTKQEENKLKKERDKGEAHRDQPMKTLNCQVKTVVL